MLFESKIIQLVVIAIDCAYTTANIHIDTKDISAL